MRLADIIPSSKQSIISRSFEDIRADSRKVPKGKTGLILPGLDIFLPPRFVYGNPLTAELLFLYFKSLDEASKRDRIRILQSIIVENRQHIFVIPDFFQQYLSVITAQNTAAGVMDNVFYCRDYFKTSQDICDRFYGKVDSTIIGVTGTNGKTSTVAALGHLYSRISGRMPALLGTLGLHWKGKTEPTGYTTVPYAELRRILSRLRKEGMRTLIMELSSHGAVLGRFHNIPLDGLVVTSIGQDHFDFHGDEESYYKAKEAVVEQLAASPKLNTRLVMRISNEEEWAFFKRINRHREIDRLLVSENMASRLRDSRFEDRVVVPTLSKFTLIESQAELKGQGIDTSFKVTPGVEFNVYNMALAMLFFIDRLKNREGRVVTLNELAAETASFKGVNGRFELIHINKNGKEFNAVVDFAHTPDALKSLLSYVAQSLTGRLILVFGCGGDRDRQKRPLMGAIASRFADTVYVTNDNPRREDPQKIINAIVEGMESRTDCRTIQDRGEAINSALDQAESGDLVIIAGKGHEDYQILGTEKVAFSDQATVREWLQKG